MIIEAKADHIALMNGFKAALKEHGQEMSGCEMLAIAAQLVGNLIALQDQRRYTSQMCMQLIADNIQIGNQEAIKSVFSGISGTPN